MIKIGIILIFLVLLCCNSFTQDYQFKTIGVKEGLDAADLYNPVFDPNGFIWLATSNGIYSYDGVNVSHYTQERYPDLPNDGVGIIKFDPQGRLWIKSLSGIAILEKNGLFKKVNNSENIKTIGFLFQKNVGTLIINENNISLYDESSGNIEEITKFKDYFENNKITYCWSIDSKKFLVRNKINEYFLILTNDSKTYDIQKLDIDNVLAVDNYSIDSIFILADAGRSLYTYSYRFNTLNKLDNFSKNTLVQQEPVRAIKLYKGNFYGIGSENSFFFFSNNGLLLRSQNPDYRNINGLPLGRGRNINIDSNGTVVVVHNKGFSISNLNRNFINKKTNFNTSNKMFDSYVSGISSKTKDELYINTFSGLLKWNPTSNSTLHFEDTKLDGQFITGGNLLYKDKILFTNFSNNIKVFSTSGKLLKVITFEKIPVISNIYFWKDNLGFLGTYDGLYMINLDDLSLVSLIIFPNLEKIKGRINDLMVDKDWLYVATSYGVGFAKYNFTNFNLQLYTEENGMLSNRTYSIAKDLKNNIYVASRMGVNIINNDNSLTTITKKSGLKFDRVENLLADKIGNIWITNNSLIFKYNPETKIISSFDQFLVGVPFSFNIGSKTIFNDSLIVFGGSEGLVYFPYNQIMDDLNPQRSAIQIKGSDSQAILINEDHTLHLPYDKSFLSLAMIVKDLMINDKCYYRYKISDTWSMSSKNRDLLLDLKPSNYTFEFEFSLDERNWIKSPISLNVIVGHPFWQTKWFFMLCFILLGLLSYLIYRYKVNKLLAVEQVRIKIASDLHDDVASTVGSISFYSEFAKSLVDSNNIQIINILDQIGNSARESMDSMRDIIWATQAQNDTFQALKTRILTFSKNLSAAHGVEFNWNDNLKDTDLNLPPLLRRNLYLIIKESVNNALKHAQCSHLNVNFEFKKETFFITIKDNGKGFNYVNIKPGNGLNNIAQRAKQLKGSYTLNTSSGKGVYILIEVPFKL